MPARLDHDALFEQCRDVLGQRLGTSHIGDGDLRALAAQKQGRRQTGFSQPYNQNFLAFEFHHPDPSRGLCVLFILHRNEPCVRCLTQFESGECKQCKHQGANPEPNNDFGFAPAQLFEVMMQRRHLEDTLSVAQLVTADLQHN